MKPSALRELSVEELKQKEQDLRRELFNLRFRLATGEVENPMRIRSARKDIARVLTVMTQKREGKKTSG
ncbi:MAG: 50S ribosomal protein L29 [Thermodesulfovibrionales bacterium]|jgi:large subunit ribosomal protein L29